MFREVSFYIFHIFDESEGRFEVKYLMTYHPVVFEQAQSERISGLACVLYSQQEAFSRINQSF